MGTSTASRDSQASPGDRRAEAAAARPRAEPVRTARCGYPFKAALDLAELDDRGRPSAVWNGRACELGRGHIVFQSRRMCYEQRDVLIAVHLVDDRPVPLFGRVEKSEYDGEGQYRTTVGLTRLPGSDAVQAWLGKLTPRV